jgi:hypothetical protein
MLFGWVKKSKTSELENRRIEALSAITGERVSVEAMAQRPRSADDALNNELLEMVLKRLAEIEVKVREAAYLDDLDDLEGDAETQGEFSAYLCPVMDVLTEGQRALNLLEWWGIPKAEIKKLRDLLDSKLKDTDGNPAAARGGTAVRSGNLLWRRSGSAVGLPRGHDLGHQGADAGSAYFGTTEFGEHDLGGEFSWSSALHVDEGQGQRVGLHRVSEASHARRISAGLPDLGRRQLSPQSPGAGLRGELGWKVAVVLLAALLSRTEP